VLLVVPAVQGIGGKEDGGDPDFAGWRKKVPEAHFETSVFIFQLSQRSFDRLCEDGDCILVIRRELAQYLDIVKSL
jgi:hypothetical protein